MRKNLLVIIVMSLILTISCNKGENKKDTQIQETAENVKYDILKLSEDSSQSTQNNKVGYFAILLKDNATEKEIKQTMKKAAKDNIKDYDTLYVFAYGDKKFFNLDNGATHGRLIYTKDGNFSDEMYGAKKELPTDTEKDIYIEYIKGLNAMKTALGNPKDKAQIEQIELATQELVAKKFNVTTNDVRSAYEKIIINYQTY